MKTKSFMKRIVAVALSIIMIISIMPMSAFAADGIYTFPSYSQSGDNNSTVRYYLTDENEGTITISKLSNDIQLKLSYNDGWYFEKWDTYFDGYKDRPIVFDTEVKGNNPQNDEGYYTFYNLNQKQPFVNAAGPSGATKFLIIKTGTGYYGDHRVEAVLRPLLTVNAGEGINYQISAKNPLTADLKSNQVAIEYGGNATVTYSVNSKYIVTGVSANYGTNYSENNSVITVSSIVKPATININSRLKQQKINFDANGGSGTMTTQVFEHSTAQTLTENTFTKTGYTFAGWNTALDGTGTSYANKQSVTFAPANDGDAITLYAQWIECSNHQWEDGICTECETVCSHSGGTATCIEQATCEVCREKYGELAKHSVVYNGSNNRITETCVAGCNHIATATIERDSTVDTIYTGSAIKALKISYSDNWQGGNLTINYTNNTNFGTANGTISIGNTSATQSFEITKATPDALTVPTAQNEITYGAKLSTVSLNGGWTWEDEDIVPSVNNNGYMAYYTPSDITNYDWTGVDGWNATTNRVERIIVVTVNKAPLTVTANDKSIFYGEIPANNGVTYFGFVNDETKIVLDGTLNFEYDYSQYNDVGTYAITPNGLTSNNYDITFVNGELNVEQKELIITWNNASFVYDTTEQFPEYSVDGVIAGDDVQFNTSGAATNASETAYTAVITGIDGGDATNYKLPSNVSKDFTIRKATPIIGIVSINSVVDDTTKVSDVELIRTNTTIPGTLKLVSVDDDELMKANKFLYDWKFMPDDTRNYNGVSGNVQIDVTDTQVPSIVIKVETNEWKEFLSNITFDLLYKDSQEVMITYTDNEYGSSLKDTLYFVSEHQLDELELEEIEWKTYDEGFNINPDGKYIIYAKAVDNDGNSIIVNSNGVVLDKTSALVEGITNGGIYYDQVVFTAKDELAGIKSVEIDNNDKTHFEGQYVINPDNAEHTIVVTDNAGNVTEYKITVYKKHVENNKTDEETLSTEIIDHDKDVVLPTIPVKDEPTDKRDNEDKNITSDTINNADYTENLETVPDSDVQLPQTEDHSNMSLCIGLLLISSGALIVLTVIGRKNNI